MERFFGDLSCQFGSSEIFNESSSSSNSNFVIESPSMSEHSFDNSCFDVSAEIDVEDSPPQSYIPIKY